MGRGGQEKPGAGALDLSGGMRRGDRVAGLIKRIPDRELSEALHAALPHIDPADLKTIELLAKAASNPRYRELNERLGAEPLERHSELARVGGRRPEAYVLTASEEALRKLSGRRGTTPGGGEWQIRGVNVDLPSGESVIALAPDEAERAARGEISPTLVHELIHATQTPPGFLYGFDDEATEADAAAAAELLCEGATEALTELRTGSVDGTYVAERAAIAEILADAEDVEAALEELSAADWGDRAMLVAERLFGGAEHEPAVWDIATAYRIKALELEVNDPRGTSAERRNELKPQLRRIMRGLIAQAKDEAAGAAQPG